MTADKAIKPGLRPQKMSCLSQFAEESLIFRLLRSNLLLAGLALPGWISEIDYAQVERLFNVNVHGVFRCVQVNILLPCRPVKDK